MQKRKVNPFIQALNTSISTAKRRARDEYELAKMASHKRLEWRSKYGNIFKGLDAESLSFSLSYGQLVAYVFLNELDSFKDERLTKLLSALYEHTNDIEEKDYAACFNKDYVAQLDGMSIRIAAYVKSDSPNCYRVQVGTEVREVPKYQMVCN